MPSLDVRIMHRCCLSADDLTGTRMIACRIDEDSIARRECQRLEAELLADVEAEQLGLVEIDEPHDEGEDGCDWRDDGDHVLDVDDEVGDHLTVVDRAWFGAELDADQANP